MKIGILTLPLGHNFGGLLQAFALQTALERLGHDVIVEYSRDISLPLYKLPHTYIRRMVQKYILHHSINVFHEQQLNRELAVVERNTRHFIASHLHCSKSLKGVDTIVVGSDQVWRFAFSPTTIERYFLSFATRWNIHRIAYAASFGIDQWDYGKKKTAKCAVLARTFDAISVRESSAVDLCKTHLGVEAVQVLDPTMLLNGNDYITRLMIGQEKKNRGVYYYFLGDNEEKRVLTASIAQKLGLDTFCCYNAKANNAGLSLEQRVQGSVEDWVQGFCDADFVVTDSFHGCVFSILFRKQFVTVGHKGGGMTRFYSLLATFGLTDRLISSYEDYVRLFPIDYDSVFKVLSEEKAKSLKFLSYALKG